jgi:hypothetical protein
VVENLSAAYYLPALRKAAQSLRKFLPEIVTGAQAWIKNAAEALDRFTGKAVSSRTRRCPTTPESWRISTP